jgi:Na+/H+ antiporter
MQYNLLLILSLLFVMALLYMLSQKLRVSYPIFLVVGGLLIGMIPGIPNISIDPQLIFLVFLPPLLFEAAWFTSWHEFWKRKRAIGFYAFGLVILTSIVVAHVASSIIPGFTLAMGYLLGGIISPPDAVAATTILKDIKVPKRLSTILEGESLVNDAASLIVFRFALAAVLTGQFVLKHAVLEFFLVAIMGVAVGLIIAIIFYCIFKFLPTPPNLATILSVMAPYIMYLAAEQFHFSGVLAVVSGGLFLSHRARDFMNYESRIQAFSFWNALTFVLNGLVFILIGLQLPVIIAGLGEDSFSQAIYYAAIITLLTIVIRILLVFPSAYLPRILSSRIRKHEAYPPPALVFLAGWAGMRGVVSLAAALSIPLMLDTGEMFPHRNLILFITFIVILVTLVFQGLSMPFLIRWLKVEEIEKRLPIDQQLSEIRLRMARASLAFLDHEYEKDVQNNAKLNRYYEQLLHVIGREERITSDEGEIEDRRQARERFIEIFLALVETRRRELNEIHAEQLYDEEVLREYEHSLDLEEARMRV